MPAIVPAINIGMSIAIGEHYFSTFLSSPWTTEKFAETDEDRRKIRRYYMLATIVSLVSAGVLSYLLKDKWGLIAVVLMCIMYVLVYEAAMAGKI